MDSNLRFFLLGVLVSILSGILVNIITPYFQNSIGATVITIILVSLIMIISRPFIINLLARQSKRNREGQIRKLRGKLENIKTIKTRFDENTNNTIAFLFVRVFLPFAGIIITLLIALILPEVSRAMDFEPGLFFYEALLMQMPLIIIPLGLAFYDATVNAVRAFSFSEYESNIIRQITKLENSKNASPEQVNVEQIVFNSKFTQTYLDTNIWQVYLNNGVVQINEKHLFASSSNDQTSFPYIHTKSAVIPAEGNFSIDVGVQYNSVGPHGAGIAISCTPPSNNTNPEHPHTTLICWQDNLRFIPQSNLVLPDLTFHNIRLVWLGKKKEYYIDNVLVHQQQIAETDARPKYIWLGNYVPTGANSWSSFTVSHLIVQRL